MDYLVTAIDGKEYGPVTFETLKEWVAQDRVRPDTPIKNVNSGQFMRAFMLPGLFSPAGVPPQATDWSQPPPPAAYPRSYPTQAVRPSDDGRGVFFGVLIRSVLAFVFFFLLHGIGLVVSGYGLFYAIRSKSAGHGYGNASLLIASATFVAILICWILRIQSGGSF